MPLPDPIAYDALTFGDLLLKMAIELGLARLTSSTGADVGEPALPDGSVLFKLKSKFNDGYMAFLRGQDPLRTAASRERPYTHWTFLTRPVTITFNSEGTGPQNIAGDAGRYRLPDGITSAPKQGWTIDSDGNYANTRVASVTVERVRDELSRSGTITGCPMFAACRVIDSPDSPDHGKAWEVMVAPRPSTTMSMTTDFRVQARALRTLDERHIAGPEHDNTIMSFALVEWYRRDNPKFLATAAQSASTALASSVEMDKRVRGMVVGSVQDPGNNSAVLNRGMVATGQGTYVGYTQGFPLPG